MAVRPALSMTIATRQETARRHTWSTADADGDGVSDSMWVQIQDVNSSKGKPIYAAIRIIDNGGMLNANTGYWFNVNADPNLPTAQARRKSTSSPWPKDPTIF